MKPRGNASGLHRWWSCQPPLFRRNSRLPPERPEWSFTGPPAASGCDPAWPGLFFFASSAALNLARWWSRSVGGFSMLLAMVPVCHLFVLIGSRLDPITLMVENGGTIYSQDPDVSPFDGINRLTPHARPRGGGKFDCRGRSLHRVGRQGGVTSSGNA